MATFVKPPPLCLAVLAGLAVAAPAGADGPRDGHKLVGTWKVAAARYGGREVKWPEGTTTVKHVTPAQFMWATYDKDGKVTQAAGGPYTLQGDDYAETLAYGVGAVFERYKGLALPFKCKVEGGKWYYTGRTPDGTTIEEVWERVERK
jgi:hypothetical protein